MKKETAQKRAFNYMRKHYPLLRKGLIYYFTEIIVLMWQNFKLDNDDSFLNDTDMLNYSIEINTNDEYHAIIDDYNNNVSEGDKLYYQSQYANLMIKIHLGVK